MVWMKKSAVDWLGSIGGCNQSSYVEGAAICVGPPNELPGYEAEIKLLRSRFSL